MLGNYLYHDKQGLYYYCLDTQYKRSITHLSQQDRLQLSKDYITIVDTCFIPNKSTLIKNGDLYLHNLWKPYIRGNGSSDNITMFLEFMARLFPDNTERKIVTQFLAHIIQKPEIRPSFGLLLTSAQGTGKGVLYHQILTPLLCGQCRIPASYDKVTGKHGNVLQNSLLVMLDDPKSNSAATMTNLKNRISEPYIEIEEKFKESRSIKTYSRIILASNERVPLVFNDDDGDNRRWYAPRYIEHKIDRDDTSNFIKAMLATLDIDAVYDYLNDYDLSDFNPFNPVLTDTLIEMMQLSGGDLKDDLIEYLDKYKVASLTDIRNAVKFEGTDQELSSALVSIGANKTRVRIGHQQLRLWYYGISRSDIEEHYQPFNF